MNELIIKVLPILLLDFALVASFIPKNAAAQNTHFSPQDAQQKQMQQAVSFAEHLSTQTTVPLKYKLIITSAPPNKPSAR